MFRAKHAPIRKWNLPHNRRHALRIGRGRDWMPSHATMRSMWFAQRPKAARFSGSN
jgi:hypothetical protein